MSFFETEIKQLGRLLPQHLLPPSSTVSKQYVKRYISTVAKATACIFNINSKKLKSAKERGMKGEKGAVIDDEHVEEMGAGTDIQHIISFDRPAHPSRFWLGDLRG